MNSARNLRISFNSPIILIFSITSLIVLVVDRITSGWTTSLFFSVYGSSPFDILTYFRLVGHVLGHANWLHFLGNITLILVIGPMLEEKYGSRNIAQVIVLTALVTGLVHMFIFPSTQLLGASGVVFALIILSSFTQLQDGAIPLTVILVAVIYLGQEVYSGLFVNDNISQITHILGGLVGMVAGYLIGKDIHT